MKYSNLVSLLFDYLIFFVIIILFLDILFLIIYKVNKKKIENKKYNDRFLKYYSLFLESNNRFILVFSTLTVKLIFIIWGIFNYNNFTYFYLIILIIFSTLYLLFSRNISSFILEIINSFIIYFGLYCQKILIEYTLVVRHVWYVDLGYILLSIIIIMYSLIFYIRNLIIISNNDKYKRRSINEKV